LHSGTGILIICTVERYSQHLIYLNFSLSVSRFNLSKERANELLKTSVQSPRSRHMKEFNTLFCFQAPNSAVLCRGTASLDLELTIGTFRNVHSLSLHSSLPL
jgi:hypothetical protein